MSYWTPGMTPRFTIRVWAALDEHMDELDCLLGLPRHHVPVAEIEVDQTTGEDLELAIVRHRGLELIPQKMLTA
jgi:hypothetical protein